MLKGLLILLVVVPWLGLAPPATLAREDDPAKALEQVRQRLERLREAHQRQRAEESAAQAALRKTETAMASAVAQLRILETEIDAAERELRQLGKRREAVLRDTASLRRAAARDLRAVYLSSRHGYLKLVLNQQNPGTIGRILVYHQYLQEARLTRLRAAASRLREVRELEKRIADTLARQQDRRRSQDAAVDRLKAQRRLRDQALGAVRRELSRTETQVRTLEKDEKRLEGVLTKLREALADVPGDPRGGVPFPRLKGKLPWPVEGQVGARFGQSRGVGRLKWRGVLLEAPRGRPVHAVARGRVAFVDWLRGFGMLVILDHGDSYMSLYGFNQTVVKEVGEWVEVGDMIARVGDTGGRDTTGLYFELRRGAKPVDPLAWCTPDGAVAKRRGP